MEWLVTVAFAIFLAGFIMIGVEAIRHAYRK